MSRKQKQPVLWEPHEGPQTEALSRIEFEILLGGARGGGKTDAGLAFLLYHIDHKEFRALVIRKNADDLSDWIDRAGRFYSHADAKVVGRPAEIRFPSGAIIRTGHLKDDNAYEKYQGHEYHTMILEELTQIPTEDRYMMLLGSCRSSVKELSPQVFCTTNPGGPGHAWVKKRFVDVTDPGVPFVDPITKRKRIFIPAKITDNPSITTNDPGYIHWLDGLQEPLRSMWRDGNWEVFAGQFFPEFDLITHVFDPMKVKMQDAWPRYLSVDWGYRDPMAIYWHAVGPDRHIYTYREMYVTETLDVDAAKEAVRLSHDSKEKIEYGVGDPSSFPVEIPHLRYGRTIAVKRSDVWSEQGMSMVMGNNTRIPGWSRMREYLKPRDYMGVTQPWWHISAACPRLIEELQGASYDKRKVEDLDAKCSDHALDSCRYFLMSCQPLLKDKQKVLSHLEAAEKQYKRQEMEERGNMRFV